MQRLVFRYDGKDAYHTRAASFSNENDWRIDGYLYFKGKQIDRFGIDYQMFLNKLYLAVYKNPIFFNTLKSTANRELLHSDGVLDPHETILTPREYINRLIIMRDAIKSKQIKQNLNALSNIIVDEYRAKGYAKR